MVNMSAKFGEEAHNGLDSIIVQRIIVIIVHFLIKAWNLAQG